MIATKRRLALYTFMQIRQIFVLAGLAACAVDPQPELDTVERCAKYFCGGNSPVVGHYGFWELNIHGDPNDQGVELLGLSKGRTFYDVAVVDSRLRARDATGNELTGTALQDAILWIRQGSDQYGIAITEVGEFAEVVPTYVPAFTFTFPFTFTLPFKFNKRVGSPYLIKQYKALETYVLDWSAVIANPLAGPIGAGGFPATGEMPVLDTNNPPVNVCPPPDRTFSNGGEVEFDPTARMSVYHSLLFEGDRFSLDGRTVKPAANDDWFNIGCGAHTLAKLRLTRNTMHTTASWQNVQAAFKMLSGDYCGTGTPFTVDGEPLVWRDRGAMQFFQTPMDLEARWDENGATCLNSPRLARSTHPLAQKVFDPALLQAECANHPLPPCQELNPQLWEGNELVVSGNYD